MRESDGLTTVVYDVYVQFAAPVDDAGEGTAVAREQLENGRQFEERKRFQEELEQLKKLVERAEPGA